jgi:hypothetical protein
MKKITMALLLLAGVFTAGAQDMKQIEIEVLSKQYVKAKASIDKFLAVPANATKPEPWYYKAYVYNALTRDSARSTAQNRAMNAEAYAALQKYRELDAKAKLTGEEENTTYYNIYYSYYDLGIKAFGSKDYPESYNNFKNALEVHDFLYNNKLNGPKGLHFAQHDTDVIWNLVVLGNELKKDQDVAGYYQRIADAGLSDEKYFEAYQGMLNQYKGKDRAQFKKYLEKGKQLYPKNDYWEAIDIENEVDGLEKEPLFKKYDELLASYPKSYVLNFNYGLDLTKYLNSDEAKASPQYAAYREKLPQLFKTAVSVNSTADANMLLAQFYYNNYFDLGDSARAVKGTKPADVKKKETLNAAAKSSMNMSIAPALEAARIYNESKELKGSAKANLKLSYEILASAYKLENNAAKAAEYEKLKSELEKK